MTNIFYLCTRLTYGIAEYFHEKGYGSPLWWSVLHTIEVSETISMKQWGTPLFIDILNQ